MPDPIYTCDIFGRVINPGVEHSAQYPWENIADITVVEAALAGNEKNSTYIDALGSTKCGIFSPEDGEVAFEVRVRSDGNDGDINVIEMYAAAGDITSEYLYRRIATLTWTQGTGEYTAAIFFSDELAVTNDSWLTPPIDCGVDSSNGYASYVLNIHGHKKFAFIMSTKAINTTHLYIDKRRF